MVRFQGQALPDSPKIAVIANDAIGNFVVATPLLQMLRSKYSGCRIMYFGGKRTLELQHASGLFEEDLPLHGAGESEVDEWGRRFRNAFDLVVNIEAGTAAKRFGGLIASDETPVCGPCASPVANEDLPFPDDEAGRLWMDKEWIAEDIVQKYPSLQSGFIGEIFCRASYLKGPLPTYKVPSTDPEIAIPDILIAASASLEEKLWPVDSWSFALQRALEAGRSVGLLGAKPEAQKSWLGSAGEEVLVKNGLVVDLRGRMSMPQVVGALANAKAVLTLDNGILHLAVAAGAKTVGIYRHGIHRLWAPPYPQLRVLTPGEGNAVASLDPQVVWDSLQEALTP